MTTHRDPDLAQEVIRMRAWARKRARMLVLAVVGGAMLLGAWSSYYEVQPDELGVVLRFGKHIGNSEPGPHFKIPLGVDQVIKVPVGRQLKMEFGFRTSRADVRSAFTRPPDAEHEAEMLTGDLNVAIVEWIVQYRVTSPERFLFRFRDIDSTLRLMSEAVMRAVIGDHSIDEVLTEGRAGIEVRSRELLQELADRYETGISIQQLKLQDVNAPDPVRPALREVEEAKQERERVVNEAWAEYNGIIPKARGLAEQSLQAAEGYAIERTNRAEGDAGRFKALHEEFRKAPEVTRTRLYMEALQEILAKTERKVVVDTEAKSLLPLLNLGAGGGAK